MVCCGIKGGVGEIGPEGLVGLPLPSGPPSSSGNAIDISLVSSVGILGIVAGGPDATVGPTCGLGISLYKGS